MASFTDEKRAWINERWTHMALDGRHEMIDAVLLPHDVFARLSTNLLMHDAREGALVYRIFEEEFAAALWLRQVL